jgi:hypothetical protein
LACEFGLDLGERPLRIRAGGAHEIRREPLLVIEENLQEMFRKEALMAAALGERLGALHKAA